MKSKLRRSRRYAKRYFMEIIRNQLLKEQK